MNTSSTTEERIWAVLSHLSVLALGMGILLPIIGWSEQRRKSKYASFQCLQALGYQSLGYTVWILSYLLAMIVLIIIFAVAIGTSAQSSASVDRLAGIWTAIFVAAFIGLFGIYLLLPIIAAIACGLGIDFRYPILGKRLAKYLGYQQTDNTGEWLIEEHEDHWVAAMGHFGVIIILWGMLAPLTVWVAQGKRNLFLKFQSIQALIFQAGVTVLYFGALFIYLFGFFALAAAMGIMGTPQNNSPTAIVTLIIFAIFSLIAFAIFLVIPLFHILGQWAGYRLLKGDDYKYPIIGRFVERWMAKNRMSL